MKSDTYNLQPQNNQLRFEVIYAEKIENMWSSSEEFTKEYNNHIGYGSYGSYEPNTKHGYIASHLKKCKELETQGYKNLKFNNGGDDDVLIVDHKNKEFGFFENPIPPQEQLVRYKNLKQLFKSY